MGFADLWNRTLVYFGIAEEDDYWDEDGYSTNEELERTYNDRPNVRRLPRRARGDEYEDWAEPEPSSRIRGPSGHASGSGPVKAFRPSGGWRRRRARMSVST